MSSLSMKNYNFKKLFFYFKNKFLTQKQINLNFLEACNNNDKEQIKYWLTSRNLKKHANTNVNNGMAIKLVLENNHNIELAKYFITSKELFPNNIPISSGNNYIFKYACENNNQELIKYLLTSPDLEKHIDMHSNCGNFSWTSVDSQTIKANPTQDYIFIDLLFNVYRHQEHHGYDNREVINFLLTSPDLPERFDLTLHQGLLFPSLLRCYKEERSMWLSFFACDLNVRLKDVPDFHNELLLCTQQNDENKKEIAEEALSFFEKTELNYQLQDNFNTIPNRKKKTHKI